jgi:hypothetical protein
MAPIGHRNGRDLLSTRLGCQVYVPNFGIDLAALC